MTDAEAERQQARLQALADMWIKPLGLAWWHIKHEYRRECLFDDDGDPEDQSVARCAARWQYAQATIRWNLARVAEESDAELEAIYLHELGHIFLNEMRELRCNADNWLQHEERTATVLAKAFLWTRDAFARECGHAEESQPHDAA